MDEAKITGMTPPVFTFNGICVLPAIHPSADHALRILHRDTAAAALDEDDGGDDEHHHEDQQDQPNQFHLAGAELNEGRDDRARHPTTMPAKMISDMPLPMPRSVICSPSHMMSACRWSASERSSTETPARVVRAADRRQLRRPLERCDAERLHDAEDDREVTGLLRDLASA